ncbi:MAG TPA: nuclear transport factor 2 family protein [Burkholderiales bacterium]|nr:nuclear transport factor 2 family protein [Burkholderiales bacterium]
MSILSIRALFDFTKIRMVPAGAARTEDCSGTITAEEALRAEEARYNAQMANDFAAMERLFGDDLVYIHSSTVVDTKASFIDSMRSGTVKYRRMRRGEVKVRTYGCIAIISGRGTFEVTVKGEDRTLDLLFHSVWAKRAAGAQFVSWQATRMPPKA